MFTRRGNIAGHSSRAWRTTFALAFGALGLPGLLGVAACGSGATPETPQAHAKQPAPTKQPAHVGEPERAPQPAPAPPDPRSGRANELGQVPVLMYHHITNRPSSVYDRTSTDFRSELERLAQEGYVPVTTEQYATGDIDIPAGRHPVVLTFDDGSPSQLTLDPAGNPAPGTAVRILRDVAARNPGFRAVASFYVFDPPFGEPGGTRTLRWLHEHGFEIGNHTRDHETLDEQDAAGVQHQIAAMQREITAAVPGARVRSLSLPLGVRPSQRELVLNGNADDVGYRHVAALLVGANPAKSPFDSRFDPLGVPRIRSQGAAGKDADYGSTAWLDKLAAHPQRRYTSDGVPGKVSFPSEERDRLSPRFAERARPY